MNPQESDQRFVVFRDKTPVGHVGWDDLREMIAANNRVERLRPWRIAQLPDGIFTVTKGSGFTMLMSREEAEHVVAQLALLLGLDQETP